MPSFSGVRLAEPRLSPVAPDVFSATDLRVAVVGGTGGLGRAMARFLASRGAQVTVVGQTFRDADVPGIDFLKADLSLMSEARRVGRELPAEALDALVLTTGIVSTPTREVTAEGIERDLAVSYLSRVEIVRAVAPRIGTGRADRSRPPRIFVMGFPGTENAGVVDDINSERDYQQTAAHMNTVAGNEALVLHAARTYPEPRVFGLNPGLVKTDIRANALGGAGSLRFRLVETLIGLFTASAETYASRVVPAMFAPELDGASGIHLDKKGHPLRPSAVMTDAHVAAWTAATEALLAAR